jgi:hypothetical protein
MERLSGSGGEGRRLELQEPGGIQGVSYRARWHSSTRTMLTTPEVKLRASRLPVKTLLDSTCQSWFRESCEVKFPRRLGVPRPRRRPKLLATNFNINIEASCPSLSSSRGPYFYFWDLPQPSTARHVVSLKISSLDLLEMARLGSFRWGYPNSFHHDPSPFDIRKHNERNNCSAY